MTVFRGLFRGLFRGQDRTTLGIHASRPGKRKGAHALKSETLFLQTLSTTGNLGLSEVKVRQSLLNDFGRLSLYLYVLRTTVRLLTSVCPINAWELARGTEGPQVGALDARASTQKSNRHKE